MPRLLRLQRTTDLAPASPPAGIHIVPYRAELHHSILPDLYAQAFGDPPWPVDWNRFAEFDPQGVFLGVAADAGAAVGFVVSFQRRDFGYVSVVAVLPAYRRVGIASALVGAAIGYLRSRGLETVRIDVYEANRPAVWAYERLGFQTFAVLDEE